MKKKTITKVAVATAAVASVIVPQQAEAKELVATFSIDVDPSIDGQTLEEAAEITKQILGAYNVSESILRDDKTNEEKEQEVQAEVLQALSKVINADKFDISFTDFGFTCPTEHAKGSLGFNVELKTKDGSNTSKICTYDTKVLRELPQSAKTVADVYREKLANLVPTTAMDEEYIKGLVPIHNSNLKVEITNYEMYPPSRLYPGELCFVIVVTDTTDDTIEEQVPYDEEIKKLSDGLASAAEKVQSYINTEGTFTNDTTATAFISTLNTTIIEGGDVTASWSGEEGEAPKKVLSTATSEGRYTGVLVLTDTSDNSTVEIKVNAPIEQLNLSVDSAMNLLKEAFKDYNFSEKTTEQELQAFANQIIDTGYNTDDVTATIGSFTVTPATVASTGSVSFEVNVSDKSGNSDSFVKTASLKAIEQTSNIALELVQSNINNVTVNNDTTESDIISQLYTLTKLDSDKVKLTTSDFELQKATGNTAGRVTCKVLVESELDDASGEVALSTPIEKLEETQEYLKEVIDLNLSGIKVSNETTQESLLEQIYTELDINRDKTELAISDFEKEESTGVSNGKITGLLTVTAKADGTSFDRDFTFIISSFDKTDDEVKDSADKGLEDLEDKLNTGKDVNVSGDPTDGIPPSSVTPEWIIKYVTTVIGDDRVEVSWVGDVTYVAPTKEATGLLKGHLIAKDKDTKSIVWEKDINYVIPKIASTEEDIKEVIKDITDTDYPSNNSKEEDILNKIKDTLGDRVKDVRIENYVLVPATQTEEGSISYDVVYTMLDDSEHKEHIEKAIPKIVSSVEDVTKIIDDVIEKQKPSNNTSEEDVKKILEDALNERVLEVTITDYKVVPATKEATGGISYDVNYKLLDGSEHTEHVEMVIQKIPLTQEDVKQIIADKIKDTDSSNSTTEDDILKELQEVLGDRVKAIRIENFKIVEATKYKTGLISYDVVYTLLDNSEYREHVEKEIPKGAGSGSGSHGSGSHSSGSHSSSSSHSGSGSSSSGDIGGGSSKDDDDDDDDDDDKSSSSSDGNHKNSGDIGSLVDDYIKSTSGNNADNDSNSSSSGSSSTPQVKVDSADDIRSWMDDDHLDGDKYIAKTPTEGEELTLEIRTGMSDRDIDFQDVGVSTIENEVPGIEGLDTGEGYSWIEGNGENAGEVTFVRNNNDEIVGLSFTAENQYALKTLVSITSADLDFTKLSNVYVYNENTKVYSPIDTGKAYSTDNMIFQTTKGTKYLILGSNTEGVKIKLSNGWVSVANGKTYYDENGVQVKSGWKQIDSKWYFFNAEGIMQTGWLQQGAYKYFLNDTGDMATGWRSLQGKWYFFDKVKGDLKTGWINDANRWYYAGVDGMMQTGWIQDSGKWYFLDDSGAMRTGWVNVSKKWYFLDQSGAMKTNTWVGNYYVGADGAWTK